MARLGMDELPICRICHGEESPDNPNGKRLFYPCKCKGSIKFVHQGCLESWMQACGNQSSCELCGYKFKFHCIYSKRLPCKTSKRIWFIIKEMFRWLTPRFVLHWTATLVMYCILIPVCIGNASWLSFKTPHLLPNPDEGLVAMAFSINTYLYECLFDGAMITLETVGFFTLFLFWIRHEIVAGRGEDWCMFAGALAGESKKAINYLLNIQLEDQEAQPDRPPSERNAGEGQVVDDFKLFYKMQAPIRRNCLNIFLVMVRLPVLFQVVLLVDIFYFLPSLLYEIIFHFLLSLACVVLPLLGTLPIQEYSLHKLFMPMIKYIFWVDIVFLVFQSWQWYSVYNTNPDKKNSQTLTVGMVYKSWWKFSLHYYVGPMTLGMLILTLWTILDPHLSFSDFLSYRPDVLLFMFWTFGILFFMRFQDYIMEAVFGEDEFDFRFHHISIIFSPNIWPKELSMYLSNKCFSVFEKIALLDHDLNLIIGDEGGTLGILVVHLSMIAVATGLGFVWLVLTSTCLPAAFGRSVIYYLCGISDVHSLYCLVVGILTLAIVRLQADNVVKVTRQLYKRKSFRDIKRLLKASLKCLLTDHLLPLPLCLFVYYAMLQPVWNHCLHEEQASMMNAYWKEGVVTVYYMIAIEKCRSKWRPRRRLHILLRAGIPSFPFLHDLTNTFLPAVTVLPMLLYIPDTAVWGFIVHGVHTQFLWLMCIVFVFLVFRCCYRHTSERLKMTKYFRGFRVADYQEETLWNSNTLSKIIRSIF